MFLPTRPVPFYSLAGSRPAWAGLSRTIPYTTSATPPVASNMRPGSICLVRLTSSVEGKQATFTINREGDPDLVLTSVELSQETRPQRTVSLAAEHKESELLHDELEILGHDYPFEQTLEEIAELLG